MLIYADGGALARGLVPGDESDLEPAAWSRFAAATGDRLVTSPLGLTELRRAADPLGAQARAVARQIADQITVLRFSDQSLRSAAMASAAVRPFTAIHVGIAVAHPEVESVATYDLLLARLSVIYGLAVVTPGRLDEWWRY